LKIIGVDELIRNIIGNKHDVGIVSNCRNWVSE